MKDSFIQIICKVIKNSTNIIEQCYNCFSIDKFDILFDFHEQVKAKKNDTNYRI